MTYRTLQRFRQINQEVDANSGLQTEGLSGTINATDLDSNTQLDYGILGGATIDDITSLEGTFGTLEVNKATGNYLYKPNNGSIETLDAGDTQSDTFVICVSDGMAVAKTTFNVAVSGASERIPGGPSTPSSNDNPDNDNDNDRNNDADLIEDSTDQA